MPAKPAPPEILYNTPEVDAYIDKLDHPLKEVLQQIRKVILASHVQIGEHIKWNAPSFAYTGEMPPFNPKEYKRHIIVSNVFKKDLIRLVFPSGSKLNDNTGLLEGDYADGRRIATIKSLDDLKAKKPHLQDLVRRWIAMVE